MIFLILVSLSLSLVGCTETPIRHSSELLVAVPKIELNRYLGKWYEIASRPNRFQKNCVATTATYAMGKDSPVSVFNECRDKTLSGELRSVRGKAWPVDESNSKFKVSFFWPFKGNYWILEIGANYEYSVVGEPDGKYVWILSRQPHMDEKVFQGILGRLKERGYSLDAIIKTLQPS